MKAWAWRLTLELLIDDKVVERRSTTQGAFVEHVPLERHHAIRDASQLGRRVAKELLDRAKIL